MLLCSFVPSVQSSILIAKVTGIFFCIYLKLGRESPLNRTTVPKNAIPTAWETKKLQPEIYFPLQTMEPKGEKCFKQFLKSQL